MLEGFTDNDPASRNSSKCCVKHFALPGLALVRSFSKRTGLSDWLFIEPI